MQIRFVELEDTASILEIYRPYVEDTIITFECECPTHQEMSERIKQITSRYPYIVAIVDNQVVGYAYGSTFRNKEAYDTSVELSVYVDQKYFGKKIGQRLFKQLLELLTYQGFRMAYSCVSHPNLASDYLHEQFNFEVVGVFSESGYKFNQYIDVKFYQKKLNDKHIGLKCINAVINYYLNK